MKSYREQFREIEKKWQKIWDKDKIFCAKDFDKKHKKYYCLVEFPYPSGAGLHMGHVRSYFALDALCRKKRMQGMNVLFPMGWDAFGLPAENYAIKAKQHPAKVVAQNVATFKRQIQELGIGFDWSREINTTDPKYYRWTQWIFLKLHEAGLAYKDKCVINWCPSCKIGLANEELEKGKCERCGCEVERRQKEQWMLKMTKYADRLINGLDSVDYLDSIVSQQRNWIGRSQGAELEFPISSSELSIKVFTTRPDTLFGATYMVLAPEHELIDTLKERIKNWPQVDAYRQEAQKKTELEREAMQKGKTGVLLDGIKAINPATKEEIPIFVADYVLASYGTGAVMAVPAHDERDFEFAKNFNLPITMVICPNYPKPVCPVLDKAYVGEGVLVASGEFSGMPSEDAKKAITEEFGGTMKVIYRLRDWVFSRQRYWGEPIPMVHCKKCGWVRVPKEDLPVTLPDIEYYEPTDTGESPLAAIEDWVNTTCPSCGGPGKRETDTMPNWAGSSWYWLRYTDPKNDTAFADSKNLDYWTPVDLYNGGMEHATRHLLYARFWHKFLYDQGLVPTDEPFRRRVAHGMINSEDGSKMSKSKGNVVNPDDIAKKYGADTLRMYELFMGPYDEAISWSSANMVGMNRFLHRVYTWVLTLKDTNRENPRLERLLHKTIKKVTEDIDGLCFNTAISALMIYLNIALKEEEIPIEHVSIFLKLLYPFAPHLACHLWEQRIGNGKVYEQRWPEYDIDKTKEETITLVVQINGKVRAEFLASADVSEQEAKELALQEENVKKYLHGKNPKRVIYVKGKLVSIVV